MFQLQAEVSSLTAQAASLRKENASLQQTLVDQETSFSYALRSCHSEKMERDDKIHGLEEQVAIVQ